MQLKLQDIFRIDIKNYNILLAKTLQESFMVTHNWVFTLWRAKVLTEIIFKKIVFENSSHGSQY